MKLKYPQYFLKLVIFSLLLASVPVIITSAVTTFRASDIIQKRVTESNMQVMVQTKMRIEQTLKMIDSTIVPFQNSPVLAKIMEVSFDHNEFDAYDEISRNLFSLRSSDLPYYNIYLVNFNKGWVISNTGLCKLDELTNKEQIYKYNANSQPSFWVREEKTSADDSSVNCYSPIDGVCLIKKIPINASKASGLIIVQIHQTELDKFVVKDKQLGRVMILDQQDCILHSEDKALSGKDISFLSYVQYIKSSLDNEGVFETRLDSNRAFSNDKSVVIFLKSQYNGWTYLSILSKREVTKETRNVGNFTALVCLVILMISGILSVFFTRRIYHPIGEIYQTVMSSGNNNKSISKGDEITSISESLNLLIKDNSIMKDQLNGQKQQFKEFLVMKLLQARIREDDIEAKMSIFSHRSFWKWMCILSINIDNFEGALYDIEDNDLVMFAISNVVGDLVPQEHQLCPVIMEDCVAVLIGGSFETTEIFNSYINSIAKTIQESLDSHINVKVNIGISRPFEELTHAHEAFQESREALKYRIRSDHEAILFIENIRTGNASEIIFPKEIENRLIEAIKFGDKGKSQHLLQQVVAEIVKNKTSLNRYQVSLMRLAVDIANILPEGDDSPLDEYIDDKSFVDRIMELKNVQEIQEWFLSNVVMPIFEKIAGNRMEHQRRISDKMIQIIENEYDKDLDLEVCANRLNYHPNYIRRVFVEETGITFSEYLSQYRINIAKKWLIDTDMKIAEIAEKLRYNNSQNFIRSFRKKESITPGDFRMQHSQIKR